MKWKCLNFIFLGFFVCSSVQKEEFEEIFKWKQIEFDLSSKSGPRNPEPNYGYGTQVYNPNFGYGIPNYGLNSGAGGQYHHQHHNHPNENQYSNQNYYNQPHPTRYTRNSPSRFYGNDDYDDIFRFKRQLNGIFHQHGRYFRRRSTENSEFIQYNNVPMGVTHYKGRLFITIPRRRPGIPSTLNYVSYSDNYKNLPSPKLIPFPDLETNQIPDSTYQNYGKNRIVSVYRTRLDDCNRLWFIDIGILEYPNNIIQVQLPSIWVYDLKINKTIKRFEIPSSVVSNGRGLASITVDVDPQQCDKAYAYIPDLFSYSLHVYSLQDDDIWTFKHNYLNFDPLEGDFEIGGQKFQWNDGIFSITLGNRDPNGFRTAYFHPMVSISEFSISTEVLQDKSNSQRSYHNNDFKHLGKRGPKTQSTMHDFDPKSGTIFFAEIAKSGIGCWNTKKSSDPKTDSIQSNNRTMIYPSDLTIDHNRDIWVMTNSMPIFIYSTLNTNDFNFRIWRASADKAIEGSLCQSQDNFTKPIVAL